MNRICRFIYQYNTLFELVQPHSSGPSTSLSFISDTCQQRRATFIFLNISFKRWTKSITW